jgi:SSS family solute:Na+ symporter
LHPIDLAVVVAYVALITFVGIRFAQRVKTAKDFFLAGRSLTWWVIGLSIIGTNVDTNGYIGASGNAYSIGIAQANFEWIGAIPAMIIAALIFIPLYWRAGVYSIPEYLGLRYNQAVRVVAASIVVTVSVFAMGVAMWALAITLQTFIGWPIWLGILVSGTVVGLYSVAGGLGAVAITDSIQVCIMFLCGLIIVGIGISDAGGSASFVAKLTAENPTHLQAYLPSDHESYPWHGVILGLGLVLSPAYWVGGQAILQRTLGAKTQWDASAGMMFAAVAKTFVPVLIVFPGLLALVMMAEIEYPDMALPWVIKNVLPVGVSGLMFVAIIAALQSSIDSSINSTALIITRDIRHVLMKNHNPESDLRIGRLLTLVLAAQCHVHRSLHRQSGRHLQFLAVPAVVVSRPDAGTAAARRDDQTSHRHSGHHYAGQRGLAGRHFVLGRRVEHALRCLLYLLLCGAGPVGYQWVYETPQRRPPA